jgi:hypothetical protein
MTKKIITWGIVIGIIIVIIWFLRNRKGGNSKCVLDKGNCRNPQFTQSYSHPCPTPSEEMDDILGFGDEGCKVLLLQQELNKKVDCVGSPIGEDGRFGCETQAAVKYLTKGTTASINQIMTWV